MTDHTNLGSFNIELSDNLNHLEITHTHTGGKIRVSKVDGGLQATPYLYADDDEVDTEELAKQAIRSLRKFANEELDDPRSAFLYLLKCLGDLIENGVKGQ